ncbi:Nicotinate phosphoribosyltransferase [Meloidogyne graminicola]|uniref:Nicotinate phosphoribosyltransferase n=1 Tax=Meloidogyne graminicola TaxID=189291 RepID=A0A8T0A1R4_9BILA|nr:Nicotinate phosphoribosyltransferase [Meloidogyne graminicola]
MNEFNSIDQCFCVQALLTDEYQLNMAYSYWQQGIHNKTARFELFFRKNPFKGEFTVFAGLEDCVNFVKKFHFSDSDLEYLSAKMPYADPNFFEYLNQLNCQDITLMAISEGSIVFPKIPLIVVEGPLAICQILETGLLNLVNFASLVTTNAARFRLAAGDHMELMEFGLRRAQGPNGGLSASKYCYIGGFDSTSNLLAGKLFGIPVSGTMAHSFVTAFKDEPLNTSMLAQKDRKEKLNLQKISKEYLDKLFELVNFDWGVSKEGVNIGELNAFCAYAIAHPNSFVALIDTYDTLRSGLCNFIAVTLSLNDFGYKSIGCRIDSGDLAYLSNEIRSRLEQVSLIFKLDWIANLKIVASNDINEETIRSLYNQGHKINTFGIGTHLVTCQKQPALGCIYKLVDLDGEPKIKISEDISKMTIPGCKKAFRLFGKAGFPLVDLMMLMDEVEPKVGQEILCRHPFEAGKRAKIIPQRVEMLHKIYWQNNCVQIIMPNISEIRDYTHQSLVNLRPDHVRPLNPTPYKVSLSPKLYDFINNIWLKLAPVGQLQ